MLIGLLKLAADTRISHEVLDGVSVVKVTIGSIWNPADTVVVDHTLKQLQEHVLKDERDPDGHFRHLTISYD